MRFAAAGQLLVQALGVQRAQAAATHGAMQGPALHSFDSNSSPRHDYLPIANDPLLRPSSYVNQAVRCSCTTSTALNPPLHPLPSTLLPSTPLQIP